MIEIMQRAKARFEPSPIALQAGLRDDQSPYSARQLSRFFKKEFGIKLDDIIGRLQGSENAQDFQQLVIDIANHEWQHRTLFLNNHGIRITLETDARNAGNTFQQSILGFDDCKRNAIELLAATLVRFKNTAGIQTSFTA